MTPSEFLKLVSEYDPGFEKDAPHYLEVLGEEIAAASADKFKKLDPSFGESIATLAEIRDVLSALPLPLQYLSDNGYNLSDAQEKLLMAAPQIWSDEPSTAETRLVAQELSQGAIAPGFSAASKLIDEEMGLLVQVEVEYLRGMLQLASNYPVATLTLHTSYSEPASATTRH